MIHEYDSRIKRLCELASTEQNSKKLNDLVTELNRALEESEERLRVPKNCCGHETTSVASERDVGGS
jgi:uncharacterized coiled-coil protein SlyX